MAQLAPVCDAGAMWVQSVSMQAATQALLSATKQAARALHTARLRSTRLLLFTAHTTTSQLVFLPFYWGDPPVCPMTSKLARAQSLY